MYFISLCAKYAQAPDDKNKASGKQPPQRFVMKLCLILFEKREKCVTPCNFETRSQFDRDKPASQCLPQSARSLKPAEPQPQGSV